MYRHGGGVRWNSQNAHLILITHKIGHFLNVFSKEFLLTEFFLESPSETSFGTNGSNPEISLTMFTLSMFCPSDPDEVKKL